MKNILFVCLGEQFPHGIFQFLETFSDLPKVAGLFYYPVDYQADISASYVPVAAPYLRIMEKRKEAMKANKETFVQKCKTHAIPYRIIKHDGQWDPSIIAEHSRFYDLMMISGELFGIEADMRQPNMLMREALHAASCPVIVVPESCPPIRHLVAAYDGSKESIHAIRQFCQLVPTMTTLPTDVIYVRTGESETIPDEENLRVFVQDHFSLANISKLHFHTHTFFDRWIKDRQPAMLISGAYGRSAFSYLMKHSFVEQALQDHAMPVFIAHN